MLPRPSLLIQVRGKELRLVAGGRSDGGTVGRWAVGQLDGKTVGRWRLSVHWRKARKVPAKQAAPRVLTAISPISKQRSLKKRWGQGKRVCGCVRSAGRTNEEKLKDTRERKAEKLNAALQFTILFLSHSDHPKARQNRPQS